FFALQARRMRAYEREICLRATRVIAVSDIDAQRMREMFGVDYGGDSVRAANAAAEAAGVAQLARFEQGDAERLPVADASFDAIICECAFCTFPGKREAASEFVRVLKPGGRVGLSDLSRAGDVPPDLQNLLAWIACIADAQPVDSYVRYMREAGLHVDAVEDHDDALADLVHDIRTKLMGAELLVKLKKIDLPTVNFDEARAMARAASDAVRNKQFGYTVITATGPA
ncbi:MAG: methyltransferase domain-containing protein, partial [Ktedonobacterales bacterium]